MSDQLSGKLRDFEEDHVWVSVNRELLLGEFSEQWIAVYRGQVIASGPDLDTLLAQLPDPSHTCIEYVTREPLEMIL